MNIFSNVLPIIGISPRNPYYGKQENIRFALSEVLGEYGRAYVMVPDIPDINNYLAYGYEEQEARKEAHDESEKLKKCVREICVREGWSRDDACKSSAQVRIIHWAEEIEENSSYQKKRIEMKVLYEMDACFREAVRSATAATIEKRIKRSAGAKKHDTKKYIEDIGMDRAVDQAHNYLLAEMAFLEVAPEIFDGERTEYIYHREFGVYENYINGRYSKRPANLSLRILNRERSVPVCVERRDMKDGWVPQQHNVISLKL